MPAIENAQSTESVPIGKKISKLGSRRKEEDLASAAAARVRKRKRE